MNEETLTELKARYEVFRKLAGYATAAQEIPEVQRIWRDSLTQDYADSILAMHQTLLSEDIPALLAEVERLHAREVAWREIGQAVIDVLHGNFGIHRDAVLCYNDSTGDLECPWCNGRETATAYQHE